MIICDIPKMSRQIAAKYSIRTSALIGPNLVERISVIVPENNDPKNPATPVMVNVVPVNRAFWSVGAMSRAIIFTNRTESPQPSPPKHWAIRSNHQDGHRLERANPSGTTNNNERLKIIKGLLPIRSLSAPPTRCPTAIKHIQVAHIVLS